jgi:hypothetical protein
MYNVYEEFKSEISGVGSISRRARLVLYFVLGIITMSLGLQLLLHALNA